jgi:predicted acetyltransferase
MHITLVKPTSDFLDSYIEAISEGNYCNMALGNFADESAEQIALDRDGYISRITSTTERSAQFPDGSCYKITSHELLWISDGARFLGTVSLRYEGDPEVIEVIGGHVGMAIRPSLVNLGIGVKATQLAWSAILPSFAARKISDIIATCAPDNRASRRLIEHNGGKLLQQMDDCHGLGPHAVYRINVQV